MYWGQIAVALSGAFVVAYLTLNRNQTLFVTALFAVIVYISLRWLLAWLIRIRYWINHDSPNSRSCPSCGQYIYRLKGDWTLTCKRCGWRAGWPGLRWFTHSVPANQLRRTIVGPSLVVFVVAVFLLVSGAGAQIEFDSSVDESEIRPETIELGEVIQAPATAAEQNGNNLSERRDISEETVEELVLKKVNERREEQNYRTLELNELAAEKAREHATDMAKNDYFSHTSLDGETQEERYSFCNGGENALQTLVYRRVVLDNDTKRLTNEEELAEGIVLAWMNSKPHRERGIFGEWWSSAGPGISITDDGKVYAVLGFCQ